MVDTIDKEGTIDKGYTLVTEKPVVESIKPLKDMKLIKEIYDNPDAFISDENKMIQVVDSSFAKMALNDALELPYIEVTYKSGNTYIIDGTHRPDWLDVKQYLFEETDFYDKDLQIINEPVKNEKYNSMKLI